MIVAGVGCRKGAKAAEIEAAVAAALSSAKVSADAVHAIATAAAKGSEPGIEAAATKLGLSLVLIAQNQLEAAKHRALTHSPRVAALTGLPSVAEVAALAAAGPTSRLLGPRIAIGAATCALAADGDWP